MLFAECLSGDCQEGAGEYRLKLENQDRTLVIWDYRGNFTAGLAAGSGELNRQDPLLAEPFRHFQGNFQQGRAHGEGTLNISAEDFQINYQGDFSFGQPQGKSRLQIEKTASTEAMPCPSYQGEAVFAKGKIISPVFSAACQEFLQLLLDLTICLSTTSCPEIEKAGEQASFLPKDDLNKIRQYWQQKLPEALQNQLPELAEALVVSWGNNKENLQLQRGEELENVGAQTFTVDGDGNRYILNADGLTIKKYDKNGQWLEDLTLLSPVQDMITVGNQLLTLQADSVQMNQRYLTLEQLPKVEGYRQGFYQEGNKTYVCKLQQCQAVADGQNLLTTPQPMLPGYPFGEDFIRTAWRNPKEVRLLSLDNQGQPKGQLPLNPDGELGVIGPIGKTANGNLLLEAEYIYPNGYVGLKVLEVDFKNQKLVSEKTLPNDYYTTSYRKVLSDKNGQLQQLITTPNGAEVLRWR
jgi:hypothetical protein